VQGYLLGLVLASCTQRGVALQWLRWEALDCLVVAARPLRLRRVQSVFEVLLETRTQHQLKLLIDCREFGQEFVVAFNALMKQSSPVLFLNLQPVLYLDELCLAFRPR
jgi:hypothetical protein